MTSSHTSVYAEGFPGASLGKESACSAGDLGSISGWGPSPGEGNGNPLQYSCLENPMDGGNLMRYSPWDGRELDLTEQLTFTSLSELVVSLNEVTPYLCLY